MVGLAVALWFLIPWLDLTLNTISTDDAYVNDHNTIVAPRVPGQVVKVLVDDNNRVRKGEDPWVFGADTLGLLGSPFGQGPLLAASALFPARTGDVLVQLDKEPYRVQVAIKQAAVTAAEADLTAAKAQVQGLVGQTRADRFKLEHAIEDVDNQVANLGAAVAKLNSAKATLDLAKSNLKRGEELAPGGNISKEELATRQQTVKVDQADVDQAQQTVYAIRVGLGLPTEPPKGKDLTDVPDDLDQNFSSVREVLGVLIQSAAQLGYFPASWNATPKETIAAFYKQDPEGNLDRIYAKIIPKAPAIKQAEAKLLQAQYDLAQAELNLRYCDVVSDIDGVVTSRNVNPGNNVSAGQSLMVVHSLKEIWIDANFKETQLADLRIGQRCAARWTCTAAGRSSRAASPVSPWEPGKPWLSSRRRTPRATTSRSSSGFPCASNSPITTPTRPPVRRPVGHPLRVLQGAGQGAERRQVPAAVRRTSATANEPQTLRGPGSGDRSQDS